MQKIAPKLSQLVVVANLLSVTTRAIIASSISHSLTVPLKVSLQSTVAGDDELIVQLHPQEKARMIAINIPNTFAACLFSEGYELTSLSDISDLDIASLLDVFALITKFQGYLSQNFDFSELVSLRESHMMNFFKTILKNNGGTYEFKTLKLLELQIAASNDLNLIQNCEFPSLTKLGLSADSYEAKLSLK